MKTACVILIALFYGTAFSEEMVDGRHVTFAAPGKEWDWLPFILNEEERDLFAKRSDRPKSAMDYYLLLPGKYFENVENSIERRVAFIDRESLSDQYLHAEYSIPSTDAGAFRVTIRVFESDGEPLIAIRHRGGNQLLYKIKDERTAKAGELIWISLGRPDFWRYRKDQWSPVDAKILPGITKEFVIDRYRNHFRDHLKNPRKKKYIALGYELPRKGGLVQVTSIRKFGSARPEKVWAEFTFDGARFAPTTNSEQGGGDQPATAVGSKGE